MLGLDRDDVVGHTLVEAFFAVEGFEAFAQTILDAVMERDRTERRVVEISGDGGRRTFSMTTSYLRSPDTGDPIGVIAVFSDITEMQTLREAESRMASELAEQNAELKRSYRLAEERRDQLDTVLKKVQVSRVAVTVLVIGLFLGAGIWSWGGLETSVRRRGLPEPRRMTGRKRGSAPNGGAATRGIHLEDLANRPSRPVAQGRGSERHGRPYRRDRLRLRPAGFARQGAVAPRYGRDPFETPGSAGRVREREEGHGRPRHVAEQRGGRQRAQVAEQGADGHGRRGRRVEAIGLPAERGPHPGIAARRRQAPLREPEARPRGGPSGPRRRAGQGRRGCEACGERSTSTRARSRLRAVEKAARTGYGQGAHFRRGPDAGQARRHARSGPECKKGRRVADDRRRRQVGGAGRLSTRSR